MLTVASAIRDCAQELIHHADANGGDPSKARGEVIACIQRLLARPDLIGQGLPRVANHVDASWILYYDPQLMINLGLGRAGLYDPPHNHGAWLATAVYQQGELQYADYTRVDDQGRPGHAELKVADERVLHPGDVALTPPPPHDVHENTTLKETYMLVISGGSFVPVREYYDRQRNTYVVKDERAHVK